MHHSFVQLQPCKTLKSLKFSMKIWKCIRVIQKVTAKTPICILKEEREHQTFYAPKQGKKKLDPSMRQLMSDHYTSQKSSLHCPHHSPPRIPKLLPYLGRANLDHLMCIRFAKCGSKSEDQILENSNLLSI